MWLKITVLLSVYSPLDMNVRSKFRLSHAASNLVKYSVLWSPLPNFNAVKSGMVRVAKTSLFLYKFSVTPLALVRVRNPSHKVSTTKMYCENCMIVAIMAFVDCTFLLIIHRLYSFRFLRVCFDYFGVCYLFFLFVVFVFRFVWGVLLLGRSS